MLPQIQLQRTTKQLKQHLKANLRNSRIIATLAKLITDKSIYSDKPILILDNKCDFKNQVSTHVVPKQPHKTQTKHPSHAASCESDLVPRAGHGYRFYRRSRFNTHG